MGNDAASLRARTTASPAEVMEAIAEHFGARGLARCTPDDATRAVVVARGAPGWVFVGDRSGSTEYADPDAFRGLAEALSERWPTLVIEVSDSCALRLSVHEHGARTDGYASGWPFEPRPGDDAPPRASAWQALGLSDVTGLADAMERGRLRWGTAGHLDTTALLDRLATALALNRGPLELGYSLDSDGIFIKWDDAQELIGVTLDDPLEAFFRRVECD